MVWLIFLAMILLDISTSFASGFNGNNIDIIAEKMKLSSAEECLYSCTCPATGKECSSCQECPRQAGEPCSNQHPCDIQKGLICKCEHGDAEGICRESDGLPCMVYDKIYAHGETFSIDCRTQCTCQNGTYGCSSLCPQEHISPRGSCQHPRLVEISGQCCREWMCDSQTAEQPTSCLPTFSKWSACSSTCGSGLSTRKSNINAECQPDTETRLCQYRRCQNYPLKEYYQQHHHLRKSHECKATHRISSPVFMRLGPCRSKKRYRPKYCGICPFVGVTCQPSLSTTVKMEFVCQGSGISEKPEDLPMEFLEPGADLWSEMDEEEKKLSINNNSTATVIVLTQWILKCNCLPDPTISAPINNDDVILHRVHRTASMP